MSEIARATVWAIVPTVMASSLLDRLSIKPAALSLLNRLGHAAASPVSAEDADSASTSITETDMGPSPTLLGVPLEPVVENGSLHDISSSPETLVPRTFEDEGDTVQFSPVSETAVENFLASVLDPNLVDTHNHHAVSSGPEQSESSEAPRDASSASTSSYVLEECRRLLVPQVIRNAQCRDPHVDYEVLAARVQELATDEWCKEMVGHAKRVVSEMQSRGIVHGNDNTQHVEAAGTGGGGGSRAGVKRVRIEDEANEPHVRGSKIPRTDGQLDAAAGRGRSRDETEIGGAAQSDALFTLDSAIRIVKDCLAPDETPASGQPHRPLSAAPQSMPDTPLHAPASGYSSQSGLSAADIDKEAPSIATLEPRASSEDQLADSPPLNRVPGLWAMTVGSKIPDISMIPFIVEDDTASAAHRWAHRDIGFDDTDTHISVHLLCLPTATVAEVNRSLDPAASPAEVAAALWRIPTSWPAKGTLVIEANPGHSVSSHAFLPSVLGEINGPLDITAHIHAGENVLRLIQLRDTSDHVFVVHAAIPSRVERRRFAAIDARSRQWLQFLNRVISTSESRSWPQLPASISAAMAM